MHRGAWWAAVHGGAKRQTQLSMHTHTVPLYPQFCIESPCSHLFCHIATHREVAEFNGNVNSAGESRGIGSAVGRDRFPGSKLNGPCSKKRITEVIQAQKMCSLRNEQIAQHLVHIKCLIVNQ